MMIVKQSLFSFWLTNSYIEELGKSKISQLEIQLEEVRVRIGLGIDDSSNSLLDTETWC